MKRFFITILLFVLFLSSRACDICGCGVGNFNPYLFPHLSKNFINFSYQYRYYKTHFVENGEEMNNRERYNTFSLTGQYSPFKNLQLMTVVPFQVNRQSGPEGDKSLSRLGDIVFLANYKLLDKITGKEKDMLRQTLLAGAGIKLATGGYHFDESNETHVGNSNFQAGTGSTDYLLNAYYSVRYRKIAVSTGVTYKMNTENKLGYRFGNRLLNVTQVKYIKDIKNFSIVPSIGISFEKMQEDKQDGIKVDRSRTGGYNTQLLLGADFNTAKWALGVNYSASVKQNLAAGQIDARPGLNIHLSYSF
ncbi:MAG: hypothetical protein ABI675_17680 [Chitinophagaceae bacterium]